jgi:sRNA-binding protein
MPDQSRKTLHLPAKPMPQAAAAAEPTKPKISPDVRRARETAEQEAKRIRVAALNQAADALKIALIERYPHLFSAEAPKPLASGIHRILREQTGAPMPVLKLALTKLTRRSAYLAALAAGGPRYDIDGKPEGVIGLDDQKGASEALQRRLYRSPQAIAAKKARWEAKQAAAAAQP